MSWRRIDSRQRMNRDSWQAGTHSRNAGDILVQKLQNLATTRRKFSYVKQWRIRINCYIWNPPPPPKDLLVVYAIATLPIAHALVLCSDKTAYTASAAAIAFWLVYSLELVICTLEADYGAEGCMVIEFGYPHDHCGLVELPLGNFGTERL